MGIPSWAVKGAKVVAVDDSPGGEGESCPFAMGDILTIEAVHELSDCVAVELVEHKFEWYGRSLPFSLKRFRPLVTQQDDIEAHFKALLNVPNQVDA